MERAAFAEAAKAHEYFSTDCFNRCWALIDKPSRSEAETLEMLALAQASFWHWTQRPARAAAVADDAAGRDRHAAEARRLCAEVADPAERELVLQDLERFS